MLPKTPQGPPKLKTRQYMSLSHETAEQGQKLAKGVDYILYNNLSSH